MKKALKYSFKALKILLLVIVVAASAVFVYVSVNKKKLITQVTAEIGAKLNGKVSIGNMELSFFRNFPHVSVMLQNVMITDTAFSSHHHPFFKGNEVYLSIDVLRLAVNKSPIKGITLKGGELYFYTDTSGYTNTYLVRLKKDSASTGNGGGSGSVVKNIQLKNIRFVVNNRRKDKLYDLAVNQLKIDLDNEETQLLLNTKANITVTSLAFNTIRGSFIKGKILRGNFDILYKKPSKQFSFDSIDISLSGQLFNMSGQFDLAGPAPQFKLTVHTHNVTYPFIKSALPERLASAISIADIDQPIDANAIISGPLKGGEPKVDVDWNVKNAHLTSLFMDFDSATFRGAYTNEMVAGQPRKDPNSKIVINNFRASWRGLPVTSDKIEIVDLEKPTLTCDLQSDFPITKLNEVVGSQALDFKQGTSNVRLNYSGPLVHNSNTNSFLNGVIVFKDAAIEYTPRKVEMKKVNGQLVFKNSGVFVEDLKCVVLNSPMTMQAQASNLVTLISSQPDQVYLNWTISTPELNLGSFLYLLKSGGTAAKRSGLKTAADKIDNLLERGRANVRLTADKLVYKKFTVSNAIADVTLLEDRYIINKVSMDHSGGHIALKGALLHKMNVHQCDLQVNMDNVNVSKVFADFDNFGQDGVTAQSLEGRLSADITASMNMDNDGNIVPASLASVIDFSLKDGALNNYEPVKKIQQFIFKKRNFDNIRFAELIDRLEIRNGQIKINRMEIQSSVLSMFVEGVYSPKGATDLSIQVPLSNLKKRGDDYNPENVGVDKKVGSSIFLRGRPGDDGNIKFKLDLFNKFDKEKKASLE